MLNINSAIVKVINHVCLWILLTLYMPNCFEETLKYDIFASFLDTGMMLVV